LIAFPPGIDCIAGLYGCLYAGVVPATSPAPDPRRELAAPRIRKVARDSDPRAVLTTRAVEPAIREVLAGHPGGEGRFVLTDTDEVGDAEDWREPGAGPDDAALLQYTSGATRLPRGVIITHANLLDNCEFIHRAFGFGSGDRVALWLPPFHDMGLIGSVFQPVASGVPTILLAPATFLTDPLSWLRAISRHRATVAGGPDFAYDLLVRRTTPAQRSSLDLSSWKLAFNGAELVRKETMEAFSEAFEPAGFRREAFYPCYGLAEATLMVAGGRRQAGAVVLDAEAAALDDGRFVAVSGAAEGKRVVGCGRPAANSRVLVVDPDTARERPDGEVGEVWFSGPSVAAGYWRRPAETAATFEATLADGNEGPFLRTGDLGFVLNGELFVTGRIADLIAVAERVHYPTDVEAACTQAVAALRSGCAAAFTVEEAGEERLALVAEVRDGTGQTSEVITAVRMELSRRFGLEPAAIALIHPRTIPRTTSGKIQRSRCRSLLQSGGLDTVARWPA
jgi:acyl-CoA synthetase (AMP-forming)/AMP-acid ligase II